MATTSNHDATDEDYIDMEVSSSICSSSSSPPQSKEFEFQMLSSNTSNDKKDYSTTSPADELFYKGKLLPLHLPPRLQMVQKLLSNSSKFEENDQAPQREQCSLRFITTASTAPCTNTTNTPLDSCNISPSESCRVSCELNPDEYYFEWTNELSSFIDEDGRGGDNIHQPKKSWSKKLKLIKDSSIIGQKLKASRVFLKSLFNKSACSDESSAKATPNCCNILEEKDHQFLNKYVKVSKKTPFGYISKGPYPTIGNIIKSIDKDHDHNDCHRRSFSRALKRHSPTKCLSSSSSSGSGSGSGSSSSTSSGSNSSSSSVSLNNANGFIELQFLKRSSSDTTEIESSIQAAIAHCKKSAIKISPSQDQDRPAGVCKI